MGNYKEDNMQFCLDVHRPASEKKFKPRVTYDYSDGKYQFCAVHINAGEGFSDIALFMENLEEAKEFADNLSIAIEKAIAERK